MIRRRRSIWAFFARQRRRMLPRAIIDLDVFTPAGVRAVKLVAPWARSA